MTYMFDYTVPDHIPQELVFPLDGESHPELKKNPFKVFANLHKETPPIFYNPAAFQGAGGWSISDGAIIKEVLQSPDLFSSKNGTGFSFLLGQELDLIPLEIDPPEHTTRIMRKEKGDALRPLLCSKNTCLRSVPPQGGNHPAIRPMLSSFSITSCAQSSGATLIV